VTQEKALVRGQIAKEWLVMMVTSAHGVTRVAEANASRRHSHAIQCASTAMAITAV